MTGNLHSEYREFAPPGPLQKCLVCVWTQSITGNRGIYRQTILPDGCVDIVWIENEPPVVAGPATHRMIATLPAGTTIIGARFRPGWAASSLGLPVNELLNQDVPLVEIWGNGLEQFPNESLNHSSLQTGLREMTSALAERLATAPNPDPLIRFAVTWLVQNPGGRIGRLARLVSVSERHLNRLFRAAVGYGPKMFQRIMRFQRLLEMSSSPVSAHLDLAGLAVDLSYSDQAHMCREVRGFTGRSPRSLLGRMGSTLSMSEMFKTKGRDIE